MCVGLHDSEYKGTRSIVRGTNEDVIARVPRPHDWRVGGIAGGTGWSVKRRGCESRLRTGFTCVCQPHCDGARKVMVVCLHAGDERKTFNHTRHESFPPPVRSGVPCPDAENRDRNIVRSSVASYAPSVAPPLANVCAKLPLGKPRRQIPRAWHVAICRNGTAKVAE